MLDIPFFVSVSQKTISLKMGAKKNFKDGEKKKKKKMSKSNGDGPNINKASKQSFKPSNDAVFKPKPQQPLQLEDDEVPDFPRGSNSSDKKTLCVFILSVLFRLL